MTFAELKVEIEKLPPEQRRELMGYAIALNRNERAEFLRKLAGKIDDESPERWMNIEEVEKRLRSGGII